MALASLALLAIVPENPLVHLDDPSHWGVIGYVIVVALLVGRELTTKPRSHPRLLLGGFLAGMPLVYVADWIRFGGPLAHLWIELGGTVLYGSIAVAAVSRAPGLLAVGIASHAVWDLAHYGRSSYVPDWYVVGCVVVDLAIGFFAYITLKDTE